MICAAQVIFVGGKLRSSLGCPPDKLTSLAVHDALTNAYIQCVENKMPASLQIRLRIAYLGNFVDLKKQLN